MLNKKDFIEIEFAGKVKDGDVFDSNIKEELEKLHKGHEHEVKTEPFTFCLGEGMFLKGVDDFLVGKEIGEYKINLAPEKAFGKRDPKLIQMVPIKEFSKNKLNPIPGSVFNFDGKVARVLTVSSGRVIVDFNHPLSGKNVEYKIKILGKVDDLNKKIDSLNEFFFKAKLKFKLEDDKLILEVPKGAKSFIEIFKDKYKEILGLNLEAKEIEEKKPVEEK
ncbi:peptidylprolyl isomerase [archaeon]|nr:peptidylprolyl isomerase [archaeon]PJC45537.1 MAG: peptidylprolyl isomerase [Candidatus Pacearchaeota archaeon CG_4_9_14_0_2_um_filter_30_8]